MLIDKLRHVLMIAAASAALVSCSKSDDDDDDVVNPPTSSVLQGTITTNTTLTADKTWTLKGYVYVASNATLTIEAGTVIQSDVQEKGALCVERGSKLIANGTAEKPIVFTSGKAAGSRARGDWGGVVILGKAPTNRTSTPVIEGGLDRPYGGTDSVDNSGSLKFVRIEYAGIAAFANSEINGLTLGGVGAGTVLENIQTCYANDDAYEFFGGTVNAKNLVAFATADDDYDFDFGYRGHIQFAVALRDPNVEDNDAGNGVESDNDGTGTTATPYTRPILSNFSWVGPNQNSPNGFLNYGNRWRRASRFVVRNSIIMGWPKGGFSIESNETAQAYKDGIAEFKNTIVQASADIFRSSASNLTGTEMETKALADGCTKFTAAADVKLTDPFSKTAPNFTPQTGSPALTGASFAGLNSFFTTTTYRGAFGTTNWMQGWTRFFALGQ